MKKLSVIAQDVKDAYYQVPFTDDNEESFDLDYFMRLCADAYAALLDRDFTAMLGMQRSDGVGRAHNITLDNGWLFWQEATPQKDQRRGDWFIKLKYPIATFSYDQSDMGLQDVQPVVPGKCTLVRDRQGTSWMDRMIGDMGVVFYRPEKDAVRLTGNCCGDVYVGYVPAVGEDGDLEVKDSKALDIRKEAMQLAFAAKQGMPVSDQTNDSNTNVIPQSETNKDTVAQ